MRNVRATAETHFRTYCRTGEARQLGRVLELLGPELTRLANRILRDRDLAEDAVQDAFVRLMTTQVPYDQNRPLWPWLSTIVTNEARRLLRRRRTLPGEADPSAEPTGTSRQEVTERELIHELNRALERLPSHYSEVLRLWLFHDMDLTEVSDALERNRNTVQAQRDRGIERLRMLLPRGLTLGAVIALSTRALDARPEVVTSVVSKRRTAWLLTGCAVLLLAGLAWITGDWSGGVRASLPDKADSAIVRAGSPGTEAGPADRESDTRVPVAQSTTVLLRLRWASNQEPAAGISVRLNAGYVPGTHVLQASYPTWLEQVSDDRGVVRFTDVRHGTARVHLDDGRAIADQFPVHAGQTVERSLELSPVHDVRGQVSGPNRRPVASAEIWLTSTGTAGSPGFLAGHSGPDGKFRAAHFFENCGVWARKSGYSSSILISPTLTLMPSPVELRLGADPCAFTGTVVTPQDRPVSGAVVGVYPAYRGRTPAVYTTTDADGGFAATGLRPGVYLVAARHSDHAGAMSGVLRVTARKPTRDVTLRLRAAGSVHGRVLYRGPRRNHDQLTVASIPSGLTRRIMMGLLCSTSAVAADGSYRLRGLVAGKQLFTVTDKRNPKQPLATGEFDAWAGVDLERHLWSDRSLAIRGSVVDEHGAPVPGARIQVIPAEVDDWAQWGVTVETDQRGRFSVPGLSARRYHLQVIDPSLDTEIPSIVRDAVFPGAGELNLRLGKETRPSAWIAGRVLRSAEHGWSKLHIIWTEAERSWTVAIADDGSFRFGPAPAGQYQILARPTASGAPGCVLATVRISTSGDGNVGTIDPGEPQTVRLQLSRDDGKPVFLAQSLQFFAAGHARQQSVAKVDDDGKATTRLFPGSYLLLAHGGDYRTERKRLTVAKDSPTTVSLTLRAARRCQLRFPYPRRVAVDSAFGRLDVRVYDSAGRLVFRQFAAAMRGSIYATEVGLPPGAYRVEASAPWGGKAESRFTVKSIADEPLAIEIPLRS